MNRSLKIVGVGMLLTAIAGCGADPRVEVVSAVVAVVNDAAGNLKSVTERLNDAVKAADKENKALTVEDLKPALDAVEDLQKTGMKLQQYKGAVERFKEGITKDQKESLAEQFRGPLEQAVVTLYQRQLSLQEALQLAEKNKANETPLKKLRTKLQTAEGEFQILTKPS